MTIIIMHYTIICGLDIDNIIDFSGVFGSFKVLNGDLAWYKGTLRESDKPTYITLIAYIIRNSREGSIKDYKIILLVLSVYLYRNHDFRADENYQKLIKLNGNNA